MNKNLVILLVTVIFLGVSFAPIVESAQTKNGAKPSPTPAKRKATPTPSPIKSAKTVPTPTPKKTVKPTPTPTAKKSPTPQPKASPTPKTKASPKPSSSPKPTQTPKTAPKASSSPKASPTPKPSPKPSPTSKPNPTPKPVSTPIPTKDFPQIIAVTSGARVRSQAATSATEVTRLKLGTLVKLLSNSGDWYQVEVPSKPNNMTGWVSGQVADEWDSSKREEIYRRIVDKTYKSSGMSFGDSSELFEFLARAQTEMKGAKILPDFAWKQLSSLNQALKAIPSDKADTNPYKTFLRTNEKSVVFSEPSAEWLIRGDLIWDLQKRYTDSPVAEEIAWLGASNPIPGECEGYVNCYLFQLRETQARYLEFYPNGKHTAESLKNLQNQLEPIVADLTDKKVYNGPTDVSDRADFNRFIADIRTIVSKLYLAESDKQKTIQQLNQIAEAFR